MQVSVIEKEQWSLGEWDVGFVIIPLVMSGDVI